MKCVVCGGTMVAAGKTHQYAESGLPNVVLVGVEVRKCKKCGETEVAIPNIEGLHRCIAHSVALRASALTSAEARFLRQFLGHSSQDFARLLGVTAETVSRWENERHPIPSLADRALRLLVLNGEPRESYDMEFMSAIKPDPPKRPRLSLRVRGTLWQSDKAA